MRPTSWLISLFVLQFVWIGAIFGQLTREDFVSDASHIIGTYAPSETDHSPASMASAGVAFLNALDEKQRQLAKHAIDSPERFEWTNLPARADAGGVRIGGMSEKQIRAACDLMAALFSKQGYAKIRDIMLADDQLLVGGRPRAGFGTENFSIVVFGRPSPNQPWAFQIDGHHVGINVAVEGEKLTLSPSFIGTQPQAFELGGKSIRPLAGETDLAHKLVATLNDTQRRTAVLRPQRGRILSGPGTNSIPAPDGLSCGKLNEEQRKILVELIAQWVNNLPPAHAQRRITQIKSEIEQTSFSWNGAIETDSDISYRILGPSLLIEYACQDLGGNPLDHLHTMYRDQSNHYGKQVEQR